MAEVGAIDPQQQLLLELGYGALHASARRRSLLMGCNSGVFLGIERPDWALAKPPSARASVYPVTACFVLPLERGRSLTEGVAGVSSFGFSGTNAHALMQRAEDGSSGAKLGLIAEWARGS